MISINWFKNPQYLLNVKNNLLDVNIVLYQMDTTESISFTLIKYNKEYDGSKKVVFDREEIIKLQGFWSAVPAVEASTKLDLTKGVYVLVPFCEKTFVGKFGFDVFCSDKSDTKDLELTPLPTSKSKEYVHRQERGKWTEETAGGPVTNAYIWRKNPQYLLKLEKDALVSISIAQEKDEKSVGFYVVKNSGKGKRLLDYLVPDEEGKTEKFKQLPTSGIENLDLSSDESYVIIPAISESKLTGEYILDVFSPSKFTFEPLTNEWKVSKTLKGKWTEENGGGSPNESTFSENPQYLLSFPEPTEFVIELKLKKRHGFNWICCF